MFLDLEQKKSHTRPSHAKYNGKTSLVMEHFELQARVLGALPADQNWIHVRNEDDWHDVLMSNNNELIRIYDPNDKTRLVAHSVAVFPDVNNPDADVLDMKLDALPEDITTLTSVTSDPDCRGYGLMSRMIDEWERVAEYQGRSQLLSVITTDNVASWSQFIKSGLHIVGAGFDDSDGSNVYFASKNLKEKPSDDVSISRIPEFNDKLLLLHCDTPLDEMKDIFSEGWVGVGSERDNNLRYTGNLILRRDNA